MTDSQGLPALVARDIELWVDSLDCLQVVVLLLRERERSWSAEEIAVELTMTLRAAGRELARLCARGVAQLEDGEPPGRPDRFGAPFFPFAPHALHGQFGKGVPDGAAKRRGFRSEREIETRCQLKGP